MNFELRVKRSLKTILVIFCASYADQYFLFCLVPALAIVWFPKSRLLLTAVFNNIMLAVLVSLLTPKFRFEYVHLFFGLVSSRVILIAQLYSKPLFIRIFRAEILIWGTPFLLYWLSNFSSNIYFQSTLVFYLLSFSFFTFLWFDNAALKDISILKINIALNPFWNRILIPTPGNLNLNIPNDSEFDEIQDLAVQMLPWLIPLLMVKIFFGSRGDLNPLIESIRTAPATTGTFYKTDIFLTQSELWISTLAGFIWNILTIAYYTGFQIAIGRACGYKLLPNFYNPLKSKSYYDFFSKINFYYFQNLLAVFIIPIEKLFSKVMNKQAALLTSFFLGISLGGILLHFTHSIHLVYQDFPKVIANSLPYFFSLAALITTSIYFKGSKKSLNPILRFPIYVLVSAIIYLSIRHYGSEQGFNGLNLVGRLFGLK